MVSRSAAARSTSAACVRDARRTSEGFTLERNGFELRAHSTALADFADEEAIKNVYYPEAIAAIREWTGASNVVVFDHTRRFARPGHDEPGVRETVDRVHDDQTFVSGPRRVRDHLPREEAEWVYFPDLSPDEVLLLKIYDSKTDGTARLTAHTAFDDPTSPPGAPAPRSIELRTLVFWDE